MCTDKRMLVEGEGSKLSFIGVWWKLKQGMVRDSEHQHSDLKGWIWVSIIPRPGIEEDFNPKQIHF